MAVHPQPTRILFVCLGNICRSPMAECVFAQIAEQNGLAERYMADSAGIAGYHIGEQPDPRMREHAWQRGYRLTHRARQVTADDFDRFDLIIGMDDSNIDALRELAPSPEAMNKIKRMADYSKHHETDHVPDPYYGGAEGFKLVIDLLEDACRGLLEQLEQKTI